MQITREEREEEVQSYYADMAQYQRFSHVEAQTLLHQIALAQHQEDHVREARLKQQLIEGYLGYIVALVKRYRQQFSAATSFADLIQEGNLAFVEVVQRFSYQQSARDLLQMFHKCVDVFVTNALRQYFFQDLPLSMKAHEYKEAYRTGQDEVLKAVKYPRRLDQPIWHDEEETLSSVVAAPLVVLPSSKEEKKREQQHAQVEALLALLTPKQREVITLHFGLSEENGETWDFQAISQHLGLEKSTAFHRWQRALRKLQASVSYR